MLDLNLNNNIMHKVLRDESTKYYLYRHTKKDINIPFYIGIGTKRKYHSATLESEYERAYCKINRSDFWNKTVNKYGYIIEILFESDSLDIIKEKEIEFISLYGRRDLYQGTLVNLTNGGEMCPNLNNESEIRRRKKISEALYKRIRRKETYKKISESKKQHVAQIDSNGNIINKFNSITEAAQFIGLSISSISKTFKDDKYTAGGYKWKKI